MSREWVAGLRTIVTSTAILRNMLIAVISNFALAPFNIVLTAWVNGPLHSTAFVFGALMACMLVGVLFGGLSLGFSFKHLTYKQLLVYGSIIQGGFIILLGCTKSITLDMFFMLLQGLALGILNGTLPAINLRIIPKDMRGRIFGILGAADTITQPLGMVIFGFLMTRIHLSLLFLIIGVIVIISGMVFILPSKQKSLNIHAVEVTPAEG
ncbi:MFS transporter [Alicyclobacillus suci]|uniref:MFS transporter n=1 Tax=Alicyclobacillus suci TaxID=2816080 RepID=UPI001A8CCE93|nr:MFS transporter [Alicyclobacillus suci]